MAPDCCIKGALCSFGDEIQTQSFHMYDLILTTCNTNSEMLKVEKWEGPPHINKTKQQEVVSLHSEPLRRQ